MKDIGDVRSSSTIGKKGSWQKTIQSATGLTIIVAHPKGFALMIEDLRSGITVNSTINGSQSIIGWGAKPASTIGWGARPVFMIGWEAESMKSQTIG
jgi:hypothetical protein